MASKTVKVSREKLITRLTETLNTYKTKLVKEEKKDQEHAEENEKYSKEYADYIAVTNQPITAEQAKLVAEGYRKIADKVEKEGAGRYFINSGSYYYFSIPNDWVQECSYLIKAPPRPNSQYPESHNLREDIKAIEQELRVLELMSDDTVPISLASHFTRFL